MGENISNSCTSVLADFIEGVNVEHIPAQAIEIAKRAIMDTLGVTIRGSKEPVSEIIRRFIVEEQSRKEATIIGTNLRSSITESAFCNGVFAHALDYDDVYYDFRSPTWIHASAPVLGACLALSERTAVSGPDFLAAFIIGIELIGAINRGLGPSHYARGWHATSTVGTFGATAAASKLLNLKAGEIQLSFGIATSLASGCKQNFGTMVKPIHVGNAARSGVLAATLANRGITADKEILDKPMGFAVFSDRGDWDAKKTTHSLGDPWAIIEPGLQIKKYPSCGGTHKALDALFRILQKRSLPLKDIKEVNIFVEKPLRALIHHRPKTGLEGKFSMEYCIACAILDGEVKLESFTDDAVLRPEIQAFLEKVKVITDQLLPAGVVRVEINSTNGSNFSSEILHPVGSPPCPMIWMDLEKKYRECVCTLLEPTDLDKSIKIVKNLDMNNSVFDLIDVFAKVP